VKLRVAPGQVDGKVVVEFKVIDSGSRALAPEVMARLYEAFYSTKSEGMGIGLSLCAARSSNRTMGRMKAENLYNGEM
jgi:C4-dicarboxylate-specific signal transduction histidine kinase